ncbi:MAG: S-layer homology domain-containing protein, partial [Syntrophomonas sp.]
NGWGEIYYSYTESGLTTTLGNFKTQFTPSFKKLFGSNITFDQFYSFLSTTKNKLPAAISGNLDTLAFGSNTDLIDAIPNVMKNAMDQTLANSTFSEFDNRLTDLGWTTQKLSEQQKKLADLVDSGHKSDLAIAKAMVRSETKLNTSITQPVTVSVGQEVPHAITILGVNATNLVEWKSSNSQIVSVTKNAQTGNYVLTAVAPGKAIITAFRDIDTNQAAADGDWLLKYEVTINGGLNSNASLKSLSSSSGTLFPAFAAEQTTYTVLLPSDYSGATPTISAVQADTLASVNVTQASNVTGSETERTAVVTVTAQNNTTQKTYRVTFAKKTAVGNIKTDGTTTNVTVSANSQNLEIPAIAPADINKITLFFDVPVTAERPTVTFQTQTSGGNTTAVLPKIEVAAVREIGGAQKSISVSIPAGTTVTAPAGSNWDGTIALPTVKTQASATVSGTTTAVIEVGAGNVELKFDKAVRLLVPGQAGKAAGYIRNGVLTVISRTLSADSQTVADSTLGTGEDGKIDAGSDMAIWTKHFTEFVSYTPTSNPPSGGGGGGGGGAPSTTGTTIGKNGGTVSGQGVSISIPANAISSDIKVKVEKLSNAGFTVPDKCVLVSDVFEITKDKTGNFDQPVTVSIPFDKSKVDVSKNDLAIYWLDTSTNKWVKLDNIKVDTINSMVSGDINHFTKFAVIATPSTVKETPVSLQLLDIQGHWAESYINSLVTAGVMKGYPDGTFKPNKNITRAEFASILVNAYKLTPKNDVVFEDINGHWAKEYISTVASYGIVKGYGANKFGPEDLITREQMAVMIVKAGQFKQTKVAKSFNDKAQIAVWAQEAVNIAASEAIINGYPDNTFKPQGQATRAEAATIIFNALQLKQ